MEIHHTGIWVSDIDKLLPFYRDVLGMEFEKDMGIMSGPIVGTLTGIPDSTVRAVFLKMGNQRWEFLQLVTPRAKPLPADTPYAQVGRGHIAFEVEDPEAVYEELKGKGVRFVSAPQKSEGVRFFYLQDPEGGRVEIISWGKR